MLDTKQELATELSGFSKCGVLLKDDPNILRMEDDQTPANFKLILVEVLHWCMKMVFSSTNIKKIQDMKLQFVDPAEKDEG